MSHRVFSLFLNRVMLSTLVLATALQLSIGSPSAHADFRDVKNAFDTGQYFSAARLAFNDANHARSSSDKALAYFWVTQSLLRAGLDQSAFYFFLRTIQLKDRVATKKALEFAPLFIERVGPDVMRKFLTRFTQIDDYSPQARNAYYFIVAKEKLLRGDYANSVKAASAVSSSHSLYPVALQIRATAYTMLNQLNSALQDFGECSRKAEQRNELDSSSELRALEKAQPQKVVSNWRALKKDASRDLSARCLAGQARVLFEQKRYEDADRVYDKIAKASFVWPDTLFEHAWSTYAKEEYNRTLGKLVSYKSPALGFVFNTEVDVLMAQSYMALCLYDDAAKVINDFTPRYANVAKDIRVFVDTHPKDMGPYYRLGKGALVDKLHSDRMMHRFLNRFVRSPYFKTLSLAEDFIAVERSAIERMDASRPEISTGMDRGFPGFLNMALQWRLRTVYMLGGIFVRNSMIDYHQILISDFEKMQFMKIDILSHQKKRLLEPEAADASERNRGNRIPVRRDDQMLWSFNGEFWNDELGDYVFALESKCAGAVSKE